MWHLIKRHSEEELKCWGIRKYVLQNQLELIESESDSEEPMKQPEFDQLVDQKRHYYGLAEIVKRNEDEISDQDRDRNRDHLCDEGTQANDTYLEQILKAIKSVNSQLSKH